MEKIKNNQLFITTTDTVLGIGAKVNEKNKEQIFKIKNRDSSKSLVIVVANIEQLKQFETLNDVHLKYINKYWPGNVTLIINNNAYRIPNNKDLLELIKKEGPFYLTSCNISNQEIIKDLDQAKKIFPNLIYFDFGTGSNKPSIIIDTKNGKRLR